MSDTITLPRAEYEAKMARLRDLEDIVAAREAARDPRIPHEVATRIMRGDNPVRAWREYRDLSLRALAVNADLAPSYLSEIESGRKTGSIGALRRLARALRTDLDALIVD